MKEYQVELKVKGEGGIYPYIVSAMKEEWAKQDAIQMRVYALNANTRLRLEKRTRLSKLTCAHTIAVHACIHL